jgi:hypothetical protein
MLPIREKSSRRNKSIALLRIPWYKKVQYLREDRTEKKRSRSP